VAGYAWFFSPFTGQTQENHHEWIQSPRVGLFAYREEAQSGFTTLIKRGVPREWLQLFDTDIPALDC